MSKNLGSREERVGVVVGVVVGLELVTLVVAVVKAGKRERRWKVVTAGGGV